MFVSFMLCLMSMKIMFVVSASLPWKLGLWFHSLLIKYMTVLFSDYKVRKNELEQGAPWT